MSDSLTWRAPTEEDIPAIAKLAQRCDAAYATLEATLVGMLLDRFGWDGSIQEVSRIVLDKAGVVGAGWISTMGLSEVRQHVYVFVDPERVQLYEGVVRWLLKQNPRTLDVIERFDRVLPAQGKELPPHHIALYENLGFELNYVEHEVLRAPETIETQPPPYEIAGWNPTVHDALRETYNTAFAERDFDGYDEERWSTVFRVDLGYLRPELSFIALDSGTIVGFLFGTLLDDPDEWVDPTIRGIGWIDSIGVIPTHTGRGISTALIARAIDAFRAAGIENVGLRVNEDKARARRLYEHLGFRAARKHIVYRRDVPATQPTIDS